MFIALASCFLLKKKTKDNIVNSWHVTNHISNRFRSHWVHSMHCCALWNRLDLIRKTTQMLWKYFVHLMWSLYWCRVNENYWWKWLIKPEKTNYQLNKFTNSKWSLQMKKKIYYKMWIRTKTTINRKEWYNQKKNPPN